MSNKRWAFVCNPCFEHLLGPLGEEPCLAFDPIPSECERCARPISRVAYRVVSRSVIDQGARVS